MKNYLDRLGLGALVVSATIAMGTFGYTMMTTASAGSIAGANGTSTAVVLDASTLQDVSFVNESFVNETELSIAEQNPTRDGNKENHRGRSGTRGRG